MKSIMPNKTCIARWELGTVKDTKRFGFHVDLRTGQVVKIPKGVKT